MPVLERRRPKDAAFVREGGATLTIGITAERDVYVGAAK